MTDVPQPGGPEGPEDEEPEQFGMAGFPGLPGLDFSQLDLAAVMRMLQTEGPVNWEIAQQVAGYVALDGEESEPPITAEQREELEELARAAESHVIAETGLEGVLGLRTAAIGRREWVDLHLDSLRPVLEALAATLRTALEDEGGDSTDLSGTHPSGAGANPFGFGGPVGAGGDPFGGLLTMLAPLLLGVQAGSMVGFLAQHALGRYDLPLPTDDEPSLAFVVPNLVAFEDAWSIERRDLRFTVAIHEVVHATMRSVPWVRERLVRLAVEYVSAYEVDPRAFEERFGEIDPNDPTSFAGIAEHPELLLGAMESERQLEILARVQGLTMVLEGYADVVVERVGGRLLTDFPRVHEAMQRHHVERGEAERFIEQLLGLRLEREHYERGEQFCRGVIERAGMEGLNRLWESERMLPTPSELDAPGLWLARIDLPDLEG
ncbi:MAG: zinc-dependent metalloprotease [Acidimicrobiia bacterium]